MTKFELKMPKMGESITEGTIINWCVEEGDAFEQDDIILEVATDKVDNEVPAPVSGKLIKKMFQANDVVPVGEVIAILEVLEGATSLKKEAVISSDTHNSLQETKSVSKPQPNQQSQQYSSLSNTSLPGNPVNDFFSPLLISIAKEHHISFEELARIPTTGIEGRLRKSDLFSYIEDGRPYKFAQTIIQDPSAYRIPQLKFDKGTGKIIKMDC